MAEFRPKHEQELCFMPVLVDEGLAELMTSVWELGYLTRFSCEGNPTGTSKDDEFFDWGYISFYHNNQHTKTAKTFVEELGYENAYIDKEMPFDDPHKSVVRFPHEDIPLLNDLARAALNRVEGSGLEKIRKAIDEATNGTRGQIVYGWA